MTTTSRQNQRTKRQKYWQRHIEKWSQSGLSQAAYCREYKLKIKSFTYFKSRVKKKNLPVQFVQVPVEPVRVPSFVKLNVGSSFQVEIPDGFSQNTLTHRAQMATTIALSVKAALIGKLFPKPIGLAKNMVLHFSKIQNTSTTTKVERSDEEIAAAIEADNAKFEEFMNRKDENGGSLRGLPLVQQ